MPPPYTIIEGGGRTGGHTQEGALYLPVALLRACCTRVNMPLDLETAEVMLRSSPRSLRHLCSEVECVFLGMAASTAATFYCCLGGKRSRWAIMSRSHPRTVFLVDWDPSPCPSFFWEMGYLRSVSASPLAGTLLSPSLQWGPFEGMLHPCEHAPQSCDVWGDAAQQPQELVPLAD